ncbi:hypothetical protein ZOSMA_77G00790 [Zostera marina]|uniref:Uncharacterized protein n=1 Tax=Zostera marina TaxID=29655 RepID=A0A0K9NQQ3_ZOSMR|nr:hypothetical protein ZOSMA_77G00790 [Zostera marina]
MDFGVWFKIKALILHQYNLLYHQVIQRYISNTNLILASSVNFRHSAKKLPHIQLPLFRLELWKVKENLSTKEIHQT